MGRHFPDQLPFAFPRTGRGKARQLRPTEERSGPRAMGHPAHGLSLRCGRLLQLSLFPLLARQAGSVWCIAVPAACCFNFTGRAELVSCVQWLPRVREPRSTYRPWYNHLKGGLRQSWPQYCRTLLHSTHRFEARLSPKPPTQMFALFFVLPDLNQNSPSPRLFASQQPA